MFNVHRAVLKAFDTLNRFVSTTHSGSGKTLGLSHIREIKTGAHSWPWSLANVLGPCLLRKSLPLALGRRPKQTLQSAVLDLWSSWKQRLLDKMVKYEEVEEPVGGGAVDVDQVADAALTFSCLLPEHHGIGWS